MTNKIMSRFQPLPTTSRAICERHYRLVHFRLAQELLSRLPQVRTYHTARVMRERDAAGTWLQRPSAWRFVALTLETGRGLEFDPDTADLVAEDHRNFLTGLRSTRVSEHVLHDRLSGQTAMTKYLIQVHRRPDTEERLGEDAVEALEQALTAAATRADDCRLVRSNRVLEEFHADPIDHPRQRPTTIPLPTTDSLAYVEIYSDNDHWGDRLFRDATVDTQLRHRGLHVRCYQVHEECGLDRRVPPG